MSRWEDPYGALGAGLPERAFSPRPGGRMTLEGGGKGSAPPPDPRLVEAQIRSMGIQDDMIQKIVASSERFEPLQEEQMRMSIDAARRAQLESAEDREFALSRRGLLAAQQDRMAQEAASFNTEQRRDELAAQARGDVSQAFSQARDIQARDMARMGVNPNDGRAAQMGNQMAASEALATAQAANTTRQQAREEGRALTDRVTNALAGYPTLGMQTTAAGAQFGMAGQNAAAQGLAGINAGYGQAGGLAGQMGANATNMWGAQANYHANMQSGDTLGGILGGVGGMAVGMGKMGIFSDRRLKENIVVVGEDPGTGLALYEFNYKGDDPAHRYRGVMADEVLELMPEAVQFDNDGYARVDYRMLDVPFTEVH